LPASPPPGSPEPELTLLSNKGGLELGKEGEQDDARTASSSYPSDCGAHSPELTVSPPMTLGRKILSSWEAYGFSNPHLTFSKSSGSSSVIALGGESVGGVEQGLDARQVACTSKKVVATERQQVEVDPECSGTLRRHPPVVDDECCDTPDAYEIENENCSTICLPRASTNIDRGELSSADEHDGVLDSGSFEASKASFPRNAVRGLKHRFSSLNLRPLKVKKWLVRQFHAGRKGPRVIVKKVRERKARLRGNGAVGKRRRGGSLKGKLATKRARATGEKRLDLAAIAPVAWLSMMGRHFAKPAGVEKGSVGDSAGGTAGVGDWAESTHGSQIVEDAVPNATVGAATDDSRGPLESFDLTPASSLEKAAAVGGEVHETVQN
jgi:hypothetical protein